MRDLILAMEVSEAVKRFRAVAHLSHLGRDEAVLLTEALLAWARINGRDPMRSEALLEALRRYSRVKSIVADLPERAAKSVVDGLEELALDVARALVEAIEDEKARVRKQEQAKLELTGRGSHQDGTVETVSLEEVS